MVYMDPTRTGMDLTDLMTNRPIATMTLEAFTFAIGHSLFQLRTFQIGWALLILGPQSLEHRLDLYETSSKSDSKPVSMKKQGR